MTFLQALSVPAMFQSKRFWVWIAGVIVYAIISKSPETEPYREQMIVAIVAGCMFLSGSYTLQDLLYVWKTGELPEKYQPNVKTPE